MSHKPLKVLAGGAEVQKLCLPTAHNVFEFSGVKYFQTHTQTRILHRDVYAIASKAHPNWSESEVGPAAYARARLHTDVTIANLCVFPNLIGRAAKLVIGLCAIFPYLENRFYDLPIPRCFFFF